MCVDNPMEKAMAPHSSTLAWKIPWTEEPGKAAVHGVAKSWTRLSDFTFTCHFPALEKEMTTHSSVLAWRIPGTGEPGGLPSVGSHRVRHDWSDLAAAIADNPIKWCSQCVCVCVCGVWLFSDYMDCSPPGSFVYGIFQARILQWVAISSSRGSSHPKDWTQVPCIFCITGEFFTAESLGSQSDPLMLVRKCSWPGLFPNEEALLNFAFDQLGFMFLSSWHYLWPQMKRRCHCLNTLGRE